mgnify:CR=1 FL=1
MAKVYDSILDLVGKTPLVELKRIEEKEGLQENPSIRQEASKTVSQKR